MRDKKFFLGMISTVLVVCLLVGFVISFQSAQAISASSDAAELLSSEVGDSTNLTDPVCTTEINNAIGYWDLDELSGPTFDDDKGTNDGICVGDTCPSPVSGVTAEGQFFFDSDGDFITIPASPDFEFHATSDFSVGVWIKTTQDCSGRKVFIGRYHPTNGSGWIGCEADPGDSGVGYAAFHMLDSNGISSTVVSYTRINDGRWHYIVGVRDGTTDENLIYVDNGTAEDTVTSPGYTGTFYSATDVTIGAYHLPKGFHFQGTLDEISIFSNALTSAEINTYWSSCTFKPNVGDIPFETQQEEAIEGITDTILLSNSDGNSLAINSVASISAKLGTVSSSTPGEYTYSPPSGFAGTDFFTYVVNDIDSDTAEGNAVITVISLDFPKITQPEIQINDEGETITPLQIVATDPNGDTLAYAATGLPTGLSIDPGTGIISGTVSYTAAQGSTTKDYAVTVTVTDDSPDANETSVNFNWAINRVNLPPEVENPGEQFKNEGDVVSLQIEANDPNGDNLNYISLGLPVNLTIDPVNGEISGAIVLGTSASSPYNVTVTVEDPDGLTDDASFTWTVNSQMKKIYLPLVTK